ncbi:MAG: hypothetical protein ACRBFS_24810 [Aureispira sp.]
MELKNLISHSSTLEKAFGMSSAQVKLMLELLTKRKIAKPLLAFKASAANIAKPGKKPFVFVEEEKGSYFFYNLDFPMLKKDIRPKVKEVKKALRKAKEGDKEGLEAQEVFLEALFDRVKKKKWSATSGKIAWSNTNAETQECFMSLEGKVEGARKSTMDVVLAQLGYDFADKNGHLLRIIGSTTSEDTTVEPEASKGKGSQERAQEVGDINRTISKIRQAIGRVSKEKLLANIDKYERALAKLKEEADADGNRAEEERKAIAKTEEALTAVRQEIENATEDRAVTKARNKAKIKKYKAQLDKLAQKLGIR